MRYFGIPSDNKCSGAVQSSIVDTEIRLQGNLARPTIYPCHRGSIVTVSVDNVIFVFWQKNP